MKPIPSMCEDPAEQRRQLREAQEREAEERLRLYADYERERRQRLDEERAHLTDPPRAVAEWNFKHNKWGWL